ncbi:DUF4296 domain-containing protein [Cytophagaceae bacterium ABcell3]|nr:DUF4296 domain-containing protein [Cytophagaceae bacterium ABcell3]
MKKAFFILITALLAACASPEKPGENILTEDQMVDILLDIHTKEALVKTQNFPNDSAKAIYRRLEQDVFKKHDISRKQYEESYGFYLRNVKLLDGIYARLVDSLSLREGKGKVKVKD